MDSTTLPLKRRKREAGVRRSLGWPGMHCIGRKVHAAQQVLEPWVGAQRVKVGPNFAKGHVVVTISIGPLQPFHRSILFSQACIDYGNPPWVHMLLPEGCFNSSSIFLASLVLPDRA